MYCIVTSNFNMSLVWPYTYSWVNNAYAFSVNSLTNAFNIGGISNAIFAFVIADNFGNVASDLDYKLNDIINFKSLGGNLRISFGGALGTMIDEAITDENRLYNEYTKIIDKTNTRNFDFDIEGGNVRKYDMHNRRDKVLVRLQENYPEMFISYTLSADTNGLSEDNLSIIRNSITMGVQIDLVNVMLMDNGWSDSASSSIKSIQTLQSQLKRIWPNKSTSEINKMIGACFMIGKNDDTSFFSLENANTVVDYLNSIGGIGQISYWALQRDTVGQNDYSIHSLYNKNDFDFYRIFSRMRNSPIENIPVPLPVPSPSPIQHTNQNNQKPSESADSRLKVGTNLIINGVKYKIEQDPKVNWMKINCITLGDSKEFGYKTIPSNDIGKLLDSLYEDPNVKVINYNWKTKKAYIKTNYNLKNVGDLNINDEYTVFIKK